MDDRPALLLRKAHALAGVLPLGVFLLGHLLVQSTALRGREAFQQAVGNIEARPALTGVLVVLFVLLPLAFHGAYGLSFLLRRRKNPLLYAYRRPWLCALQRASGVVVLVFLLVHLWDYRFQTWFFGMPEADLYGVLAASLSSTRGGIPWKALLYVVGMAGMAFHFGNGLLAFADAWGFLPTPSRQRAAAWASGALGIVLFVVGTETVLHFATGAPALFPAAPAIRTKSTAPCPGPPLAPNPMQSPIKK